MSLEAFFVPEAVAVVGASPGSYFSDRLVENLDAGGAVRCLLVHPERRRAYGRKVYPDLSALPRRPDLVFLLVPAAEVAAQVKAMARLGLVRGVVLASPMTGAAQRSTAAAARKGGVRLLGHESLGAMDVPSGALAYAGRLVARLRPGPLSVVSESGGLFNELLRAVAGDPRLGLRRASCVGRQLDVSAADVVEHLAADERTGTLAVCLQDDARSAAALAAPLARAVAAGKRAAILSSAHRSVRYPARLLSDDPGEALISAAVEGLARSTGAFLARDVEELLEAAAAPAGALRPRSRSVVLVSVSAGVGAWMRSTALDAGLEVPELPRARSRELRRLLGHTPGNPLDLSGAGVADASVMTGALDVLGDVPRLGSVLVALHAPAGETFSDRRNAEWARAVTALGQRDGPAAMAVQVTPSAAPPSSGVVRGLSTACRLLAWGLRPTPPPVPAAGSSPGRDEALGILHGPPRLLSEPSSRRVLATYDLPFDDWHLVETGSQAARRARELAAPVCLKIASPDLPGKQEAGCVLTPLEGDAAVRDGFMQINAAARHADPHARLLGVMVAPHRTTGADLFAAALATGPATAPLVVCGIGGRQRDRVRSYISALAPLGDRLARTMAREAVALNGGAGEVEPLAALLERLAAFAHDMSGMVDLVDLDTIVPVDSGWRVLDARVRVSSRVEGRARRR
jgi:acetyltransferase